MPLTDTAVRHAKNYGKNYCLKDMEGLHLFVSAKGFKSWHFRFYWLGRQVRISLGMYPAIGLKEARLARDQARALVAQGIDPRASRWEDRLSHGHARYALGGTARNNTSMDLERMVPSQYFPASLRADNINVFALD